MSDEGKANDTYQHKLTNNRHTMTKEQLLQTIFLLPDADVASMQAFDAIALAAQQQNLLKQLAIAMLNDSKMTINIPKSNTTIYYAGMQIANLSVSNAAQEGGKTTHNYSLRLYSNDKFNKQVSFFKLYGTLVGSTVLTELTDVAVGYSNVTNTFNWRLASDDYSSLQLSFI